MAKNLTIKCDDGYPIQATFYPSTGTHGLVINSAMGVSQKFYTEFAQYMSTNGISVLSYDYRGMERDAQVTGTVTILDWGQDQKSVLEYAKSELGLQNITLLGNSVGGQIIGMINLSKLIDKAVLVTSQIGDWRLWSMPFKLKIFSLWYILIPLLSLGKRFPSSWLGLGKGKWPSPVAKMWAQWGRNKDYLFNPKFNYNLNGWHQLSVPIYSIGFTDDDFAPEVAIQGLLSHYKSAQISHQSINPQDLGQKTIGHFGYFNKQSTSLWHELKKWILDQPFKQAK